MQLYTCREGIAHSQLVQGCPQCKHVGFLQCAIVIVQNFLRDVPAQLCVNRADLLIIHGRYIVVINMWLWDGQGLMRTLGL